MKADKGTYNGKCRGILFEVGETYTYFNKLIMCLQGYHFCQKLNDVFGYYGALPETKVMEIEVLGNVVTHGDKSVTNRFKVLRFLDPEELPYTFEYDERKNIVHYKTLDRGMDPYEWWKEYNEKDLMTHYKDSTGVEHWLEFDKRNNVTYYKDNRGEEYWKAYDDASREIHYRNKHGYEEWRSYDCNNNVYFRNSNGDERCSKRI